MENESTRMGKPSPAEAAESLRALTEDRRRLAGTVRLPWKLVCVIGLVHAWWVASAAADNHENGHIGIANWILFIAMLLVMDHVADRELGVRLRNLSVESWMVLVGWIVLFIVLQGIAFAGANEELEWLVGLACLGIFVLAVGGTALLYRLEARKIAGR